MDIMLLQIFKDLCDRAYRSCYVTKKFTVAYQCVKYLFGALKH